jgi:hypothetical protein
MGEWLLRPLPVTLKETHRITSDQRGIELLDTPDGVGQRTLEAQGTQARAVTTQPSHRDRRPEPVWLTAE